MDNATTPHDGEPGDLPDSLLGQLLKERYIVDAGIGEGGMSQVYRGRDRQVRGPVAIKVLRHRDPEARRRFAAEAELLANLDHPHVVRVIDRGEAPGGVPFMVLEFVAGPDLSTYLREHGPLPWREVAVIGVQVASAVVALHALGAVHRDIKPSNLIRTLRAEQDLSVKVLDFGCARLGDDFERAQDHVYTPHPRRRTTLGRVVGTPDFLPPEAGECEANHSFDVFALGVTIYQLCTGRLPRETGGAPIHEVFPEGGAPPDLSRLIFQALAADPADRLPTADHLRRGLEALLVAHPEEQGAPFADSYDRLGLLGVGASSTAFRVHDRALDRELALKVLHRDRPTDDDVIRFERAARILAHLDHPNIPTIYHVGQSEGQRFAAVELCGGVPASEYVKPTSHLNAREVILIGLQLTSALAAIEAAGVVYCDLHPGNVLLDLTRTPKAWLFDFDHSRVSPTFWASLPQRWATPPERRREPSREIALETTDYAAPEVKAGRPFTSASDRWALGLLLYRLLMGRRPFSRQGGEARAPSEFGRVPQELETALLQMLSERPQDRPTSDQIRELLQGALEQLDAEEKAPRAEPASVPAAAHAVGEVAADPSRAKPRARGWRRILMAPPLLLCGLMAEPDSRGPPATSPVFAAQTIEVVAPLPFAPAPAPAPRDDVATFASVMRRLEPQIAACLRESGLPKHSLTVQVRHRQGTIDRVRVLRRGAEHPLSICVDAVIRAAGPPGDSVADFTFFAGHDTR